MVLCEILELNLTLHASCQRCHIKIYENVAETESDLKGKRERKDKRRMRKNTLTLSVRKALELRISFVVALTVWFVLIDVS